MHMRMCFAAAKGEVQKVSAILARGASHADVTDSLGRCALHLAADGGHCDVIELLLGAKGDVNAADQRRNTPLVDALAAGHEAAVKLIANHGGTRGDADVSYRLCAAAKDATNGMQELLSLTQFGGNVNAATTEGRTALHIAAAENLLANTRFLIEAKADVNALDGNGATPLQDAVRSRGDLCAAALLAHGATLGDLDSAIALSQAVYDGDVEHLARLIRCKCMVSSLDDYDRTPLHVAASRKHVSALQLLLEQPEVELNAEDAYGHTPLDDALREEASAELQVVVTLLKAAGGRTGSGILRTQLQTFRNAGVEERASGKEVASLAEQHAHLDRMSELNRWLATEREHLRRVHALVDSAAKAERELGQDLAEAQPQLWVEIRALADSQLAQYEHAVLTLEPMVDALFKTSSKATRELAGTLQRRVRARRCVRPGDAHCAQQLPQPPSPMACANRSHGRRPCNIAPTPTDEGVCRVPQHVG
jgi:ankyrin repeat protein